MVQVTYPGVYIQERASGVRTITGVATSIAAFVGYTRKGVPDKAVAITSFSDFERGYGGLDHDSPLSYAVRQFYANGGSQALIVRVASSFASAAFVLNDDAAAPVLDVTAASPGSWANSLRIAIDRTAVRNPDAEFNLVVQQLGSDGVTLQTLETHRNLNLDANSPQYAVSVVNGASATVTLARRALAFADAGFAVGTDTSALAWPIDPAARTISGVLDGTTPFTLAVGAGPFADLAAVITAVTAAITAAGVVGLAASETGADGTAGTDHLMLASATPGESSAVTIGGGSFGGLAALLGLGLANGGREFTGSAGHRPAVVAAPLPAPGTPGVDGVRAGAVELVGSPLAKTGMQALLDTDLFNLLVIPETFDMTDAQAAAVIASGVDLCEQRRAFYILDAPAGKTLANIAAWANGVTQTRNAAVYFPPVRIADPLDGLRPRAMPPSGTLAGVYARTDATRGVWKAPAGTDATLNGVIDLGLPVSDLENGNLNPHGINVLRSFPAYGRVVWGARTTRGSDAQADEYKYVPIRRLALFLEESLYRGTQWVVFEPNDEPLWAQIRLNLGVFMNGLFRQGAFQGSTPQEAYFVKCDKETTTQADRNLGIVNIEVGFAPLKPAEFVVITIQQVIGDLS
ncbi:phage tail sheath family protein [Variovorax paradoxus]|uniref:Prophage major tail sheath protein n=1 Tax=Variovorax paradoxus TaxID=34073 RepID=A0A679IUR6_VARPD|nr:Putative prophage major tail sheath protein [Variovorax paradoxus]